MPEQKPISSIISRSYSVRILMRWASSSLPCFRTRRCARSTPRGWPAARAQLFGGRDELFAGINGDRLQATRSAFPVSGSKRVMRSISSPKNSTRSASSRPAGQSSTVSPRTRNWPRVNSMSLRVYCRSTSRCRKWSRASPCPPDRDDHGLVILLAADAVNAGDAGHHDHVAPREERTHRREPQPLDLLVDARILLDERVGARDVGLGLVVIEVADEVLDGVVGEKALELRVKLRGQRFVVRNHQRGPVHVLDDIGDRERLARAGHTQQDLVPCRVFSRA
jgi:hypothetical protein